MSSGFRRRRGDEGFQNKVRGDLVKFRSVKQSKKRLCARVGVFTRTRVSLRLGFLDSAPASGVSLARFLPRVEFVFRDPVIGFIGVSDLGIQG